MKDFDRIFEDFSKNVDKIFDNSSKRISKAFDKARNDTKETTYSIVKCSIVILLILLAFTACLLYLKA